LTQPYRRLERLDEILNSCRTKVWMGVVEAVNGNINFLPRRGRGYKHLPHLLLEGSAHGGDAGGKYRFAKAA
jgi:hypothetical protein